MARVTVEDCIVQIPNRFELVMLSAQRARNVSAGAPLTVERDRDKNPVVALREIAEKTLNLSHLEDSLIQSQQKYAAREDADEDVPEFDALEGELEASAQMAADARSAVTGGDAGEAPAPAEAAPAEPAADEGEGEGSVSLEEMREQEAEADSQDETGTDDETA